MCNCAAYVHSVPGHCLTECFKTFADDLLLNGRSEQERGQIGEDGAEIGVWRFDAGGEGDAADFLGCPGDEFLPCAGAVVAEVGGEDEIEAVVGEGVLHDEDTALGLEGEGAGDRSEEEAGEGTFALGAGDDEIGGGDAGALDDF